MPVGDGAGAQWRRKNKSGEEALDENNGDADDDGDDARDGGYGCTVPYSFGAEGA